MMLLSNIIMIQGWMTGDGFTEGLNLAIKQ